ncbi:hypothetical protein OIU84_001048 [Salix udensis]|uniref:SNF2 N-terminal domain-containing protein n=1 Tax=Salix udensis TaxID=889485 RepID=A0AAD6PNU4_9ROSI|nr:hypothetical protein OIU84_001048 [Salix udensis]
MLRRRVEDVEGSLPPKVSIVLRCRMSSIQSTIYDWIKSTGTIRVDPEDEKRRVQKNPAYQAKLNKKVEEEECGTQKWCQLELKIQSASNGVALALKLRKRRMGLQIQAAPQDVVLPRKLNFVLLLSNFFPRFIYFIFLFSSTC